MDNNKKQGEQNSCNLLFQLNNIQKTYPSESKPALNIKKLTIPGNCLVAVIGYSGSGKTTLLNILGLLDRPDKNSEAKLMYNQVDLLKIRNINKFRRGAYGFVFQEGYLLNNFTGIQNINIPLYINGLKYHKDKIDSILKNIGLNEDLIQKPHSDVSGGEAQRIAIGRAIVHQPNVILADEPTSSLDYDIGMEVMSYFKQWCVNGYNRTVIWVTHNIHQALELADYIIVLKNGIADGPHPTPENEDQLLSMLRQGDSASNLETKIDEIKDSKDRNKFIQLLYFCVFIFQFAVSDIFPKVGKKKGSKLSFSRIFGVKNTQKLNIFSLITVILLTLLILNISYAFKNYYIYTVADPKINRITVTGKQIGDSVLTEEDRSLLSKMSWIDDKVYLPNQIEKNTQDSGKLATLGAYGIRTRSLFCFMNPKSKNLTMNGLTSLATIAMNVEDPILSKIYLLEPYDNSLSSLKPAQQTIDKVFLKNGKPKNDKRGLVITKRALQKDLDFTKVQNMLRIDHYNAKIKNIPILGVTDWLPESAQIMVTEGWYLKEYSKQGGYDSVPGYEMINIYVNDKINDGLPVCNALEEANFKISGNTRATLVWIKNMTTIIFQFSSIAIFGIWLLAGSSLCISYAQAIKKKQKEIGVLLAKGISRIALYCIFILEVAIIWIISMIVVFPLYMSIIHFIQNYVKNEFAIKDTQALQTMFALPELLLPCVLLITLALAFITVFIGISQVLRLNVATILRSNN